MTDILDQINSRDIAMTDIEKEFLRLLNSYRETHGLHMVGFLPVLTAAAAWKAKDQIGEWDADRGLSHTDSQGREFGDRLRWAGYQQNAYMGEIIAAGYTSAQAVFDAWRNSPGHNAVMLGEHYRFVGIAEAFSQSKFPHWVADFGSLFDNTFAPAPEEVYANATILTPATQSPT